MLVCSWMVCVQCTHRPIQAMTQEEGLSSFFLSISCDMAHSSKFISLGWYFFSSSMLTLVPFLARKSRLKRNLRLGFVGR